MPRHYKLFLGTIFISAIILAAAPVQAGPEGEQAKHPAAPDTEGEAVSGAAMPEITAPLLAPPAVDTPPPVPSEATVPGVATPELAASGTAAAPTPSKGIKPGPSSRACANKRRWYCGVSAEEQARALELYEQGNQFFDDNLFPAAVTSYREALQHWSHPGIHYNLMLALAANDQFIEAFQASMEALRHGVQALKLEEYHRAVDYQRLLRGYIASLVVTCDEPGAVVSVDGKEVLQGPGTIHLRVRPGQHAVVARKDGYLTTHHTIVTESEQPASLDMRLLPQAKATVPVRRWSAWKPWAVVGAGVGVGLAGGLFEWRADVNNRSFQSLFEEYCKMGEEICPIDEYPSRMKTRWTRYVWYRRLGHGTSLTGAMTALSGLVLVYLNREQHIDNPERQNLVHVSVTPSITPEASGLSIDFEF
jgi:hypothetical protein